MTGQARIGHNGGPTLEAGHAWRRTCWRRARADLLPKLPVEVVRNRVARARALGLDYKTYAGVRATTGRDLVAFLFSSNALGLTARDTRLPADRARVLNERPACDRLVAAHRPIRAEDLVERLAAAQGIDLRAAFTAPSIVDSWSATSAMLRRRVGDLGLPADAVLLVGDGPLERDWLAAGRFAGYVSADAYFNSGGQAA